MSSPLHANMEASYIDRFTPTWQDGFEAANGPVKQSWGAGEKSMRTFLTIFGGLVVMGLVIISVFTNFWFGTLLISGQERWLYGAIFGLLDAFKTVLVPAAGFAAAAGMFWKGRVAAVVFAALFTLSFSAEVGLHSITKNEAAGEGGRTRREVRFHISSLRVEAEVMAAYIRDHWGVENGLHLVMDMVFRGDECRIRKDSAPANFAAIKHMASNILRSSKAKQSMRQKRHAAGWDDGFLFDMITAE